VGESAALVGTTAFAAGGLLLAYHRLRRDFDRIDSFLTVVLVAGATPLLHAIAEARLSDTGFFAALALSTLLVTTRVRRQAARIAVLVAITIVVPLIAPNTTTRPTLFTASNGFLALTPAVYAAVVGLAATARVNPAECAAMLIALVLWPFAPTSLVPSLVFVAPGLAAAIRWVRQRPLVAAAPLVVTAIVWNYWLMVQFTAGTIPKDAPVSFAAMVRQQADVHTRPPYVYPFAFPGNVISAWREGIPVQRYDLLSAEPQRDSFDLLMDRGADRFLLDGWGPLGGSAVGPYRVVVATRADVLMPLRPEPRDQDIVVVATLGDRGVEFAGAAVVVNGEHVGTFRIGAGLPSEARLRIAAADVGHILRAGYNRLSIVPSGPARIAIHRVRIAPSA
jgi:hypothetical protein